MEIRKELDERGPLARRKPASNLLKGKQVQVEGRLQTRSYEDKSGKKVHATEVIAEELVLLGGHAEGRSAGQQAARTAAFLLSCACCTGPEELARESSPERHIVAVDLRVFPEQGHSACTPTPRCFASTHLPPD